MADTLNVSGGINFVGTFAKATSQATILDRRVAGMSGFPAFKKVLANGTGSGKARYRYWKQTSFASGNTDLDLTALTDDFGVTITFSLVKWFILRIVTPATGVRLVVGNYGANSFVGWFGAAAHTEEVRDQLWKVNQIDGWTVDATHKGLRINNPNVAAAAADVIILGE